MYSKISKGIASIVAVTMLFAGDFAHAEFFFCFILYPL